MMPGSLPTVAATAVGRLTTPLGCYALRFQFSRTPLKATLQKIEVLNSNFDFSK
jgi:hypothetical protein